MPGIFLLIRNWLLSNDGYNEKIKGYNFELKFFSLSKSSFLKKGKITMLDMVYFEKLKTLINRRLEELAAGGRISKYWAHEQIYRYPWLYGALGRVPAEVMFICENPSIKGIEKANVDTIDGRQPDIEAQWWGGSMDNAAKRFRVALCRLGLKTTPPRARGGWDCYITNVIKQANIAGDQEALSTEEKRRQAEDWVDILQLELDYVQPRWIFCVGGNSYNAVVSLQNNNHLKRFPLHKTMHYSARNSDQTVIETIVSDVRNVMGK